MAQTTAISETYLIELARQRTRQGRTELFENMADLFMSDNGRLSDRERSLINGILNKLVSAVERDVRMALAERLRATDDAPLELITLLANDEIEIARPVLRDSPVLRDNDLISVIKERGREHWLAISTRRTLSSTVSDALVATGDADVIEGLLRNADAELSRSAMDYLVAEAKRIDKFHEPLLHRSDLPPELAHKLYWYVSAALRRYIMETFELPETTLDDMLEGSTLTLVKNGDDAQQPIETSAEGLAARLGANGKVTPSVLINLLRHGHIPAFIPAFADYAEVTRPLIRRILFSADGESLAVVCRACEFYRNDFATLFLLIQNASHGLRPLPPKRLNEVLGFFDALTLSAARMARRHWCRNGDYLAAIDALSENRGHGLAEASL